MRGRSGKILADRDRWEERAQGGGEAGGKRGCVVSLIQRAIVS